MVSSGFWLDDYNDIYSDFDSRHYQSRRISEDFLRELRMDMHYHPAPVEELSLFLPVDKRDKAKETAIINSLRKFFEGQYQLYRNKCSRKLYTSIILGITGSLMMLFDATIVFLKVHSLAMTLMNTVLEPASWFLLWTSVDYLIYDWNDLKRERRFYKRLSEVKIAFQTS